MNSLLPSIFPLFLSPIYAEYPFHEFIFLDNHLLTCTRVSFSLFLSPFSFLYFRTAPLLFIKFESFQTADKRLLRETSSQTIIKRRKEKKKKRIRYRNLFIIQLLKLRSNLHLLASNVAEKERKKKSSLSTNGIGWNWTKDGLEET